MKRLFCLLLSLGILFNCYAADVWEEGAGNDVISGTDSPADIDTLLDAASTEPLGRLLQDFREGATLSRTSASALSVAAGQVAVQNSGGTVVAFLDNTSATSVGWSDLDIGSEANSTTYYVYAYSADPTSDTSFAIVISTNASAPSGITYYQRLGSFYNNSSGDIEQITNDNDFNPETLVAGQGNYYAIETGSVSVSANSSSTVSFTNTFSSAPNVVVTHDESTPSYGYANRVGGISTTGATIYNGNSATLTIYWIALGQIKTR